MSEPTAWNKDEEALAGLYEVWETDDLVHAVTVDAAGYTPEALALLRRELEKRNVAPAEQQVIAETEATRRYENLVGVKGWLLLFVVVLTFNSLFMILLTPVWPTRGITLSVRLLLLMPFLLGLLGLVTVVLLATRKRRAPEWAIAWLFLNIAVGIGSKFFANGSLLLLPSIMGGLFWIRYFMVSKRVKATYGEPPALRDSDLSFPQDSNQKNNPYAPPGGHRAD
jgi:hypothetical protein